ncbi:MAG: NfeD family protein [Nitrosomonadales bacterium]|nr:NfeD family protein [Nitrosomonadales bacterium]
MEAYWIWWLAALVLVIAEMLSGTFYLIAVAFGLSAAGLSAYMGMAWGGQAVVAALLCTVSVAAIYRWKPGQGKAHEQANLAYDIGQTVQLVSWSDERHARVSYRGAEWDAELAKSASSDKARQAWRIREIVGSLLIIE